MQTYTSERIINISKLEEILMKSHMLARQIQKANPQDELTQNLVDLLKQACNFELIIERRKTILHNKHPFKGLFRSRN